MAEHFCTCPEHGCPNHPSNHGKGCDLCIQKNLRLGEIPSCFFLRIRDDISDWDDFSTTGFIRFASLYGNHKK